VTNDSPVPLIDTTVSHSARVWNYWLGGKDNYPVDREVGDRVAEMYPGIVPLARAARAFLTRAVRYLAGEAGVRQFLDIGTGLPSANNVHEVAQAVASESRVVYVDNDPIVLAHARALLTSNPAGATDYLDADLRDIGAVLSGAARTLDFTQPVAVMLVGILHCIPDEDDPAAIVATLMEAVPPGSYLTISHPAADIHAEAMAQGAALLNQSLTGRITFRTHAQVAGFFQGQEMVEPGLVSTTQWRPGPGSDPKPLPAWAGVARKP
jgi:hypothetical protein